MAKFTDQVEYREIPVYIPETANSAGVSAAAQTLELNRSRSYSYIVPAITQDAYQANRFRLLAEAWKNDSELSSFSGLSALHPAYQQIIGMGKDALPFILDDLLRTPNHWFWALQAITGENPIKAADRGNIEKMRFAWLAWGREHGFL
jgi:hypothetical protein